MNDFKAAQAAKGFGASSDNLDLMARDQMSRARAGSANPWASQGTNPDGTISQQFAGPLAGANQSLMGQALRNMGQPMDFGQYNTGTGDEHRQAAIGAAGAQMSDWFGGMQGGMNDATKQSLLNQGYTEGSPEFQAAMDRDTGWGADMQSTLGNAAIGLGAQGGAMRASQDMATKQQQLSEALRQRSYPMEAMGQMQGLLKGSGPQGSDDSEFQGALMDSKQKYDDYWGMRGRVAEENNAIWDNIFGGASAGLSLVPVAGGFLSGGANALKGPVKRSI